MDVGMDFQDSKLRIWLNLPIPDELIRDSEFDFEILNDRNGDSVVTQPR